ncbi:FAD-binding oxidoreductase [Streptomyces sp. WMMC500]|uniref:FAD-dependent oxidoreductase n=1 Tax=Streptomyces sp. WMMC500 TaxID=3015154 RepID=UPI00248A926A|nr:FAD-binding oxidoreductase [Streptomyces sp. WMMC500]WBB60291.1 FAD-binding oxidoreductase [Streptomyces sp. WMMC500]
MRKHLKGDVVLPSDQEYAYAKQGVLVEFDTVTPRAVVYCESARDVSTAVKFAGDNDIPVHTRSGGHSLSGWSTGQGMILDVSRLDHVAAGRRTVRLGPGIQSVDVLAELAPYDRQVVTGTCATIRMGGYISGGGIGFQVRKFGYGSDRLVSAQVVLSNGRVVRASEEEHSDLFWALRGGGGGNFGVVTDFEVRPVAAPSVVSFDSTWPWEKAQEIITAWQEWCYHGPRDLGSTLTVLLSNGAPGNVPIIRIHGAYHGPKSECERLLNELAATSGATPSLHVVELPYDKGMKAVYGCEQFTLAECHRAGSNPDARIQRTPFLRERTRLLDRPTGSSGVADLLATYEANRRPGHTTYLYFTSLGGAGKDVPRDQTAFVHRGAEFFVACASLLPDPQPPAEEAEAAMVWPTRGFDVIDPLSSGESYLGFPNPDLEDWRESYYAENYSRLVSVKRRYDAPNFFRHPQSIGS